MTGGVVTRESRSDSYHFLAASQKVDAALSSLRSLESKLFSGDMPRLLSTMQGGSRPQFEQALGGAQTGVRKLVSSLDQVNQKIDATGKADQEMKQLLQEQGRALLNGLPDLNVPM
jgi:hypothetical protein